MTDPAPPIDPMRLIECAEAVLRWAKDMTSAENRHELDSYTAAEKTEAIMFLRRMDVVAVFMPKKAENKLRGGVE